MKDEKAVDEQQQKPQKREELVEEILQSLGSVVDRISSDDAVDGIQNLPKVGFFFATTVAIESHDDVIRF